MGNRFTGSRLDLQSLCDLLIEVAFTPTPMKTIGHAHGISATEVSRRAKRYGIHRRTRRRNIRAISDSSRLSPPEVV